MASVEHPQVLNATALAVAVAGGLLSACLSIIFGGSLWASIGAGYAVALVLLLLAHIAREIRARQNLPAESAECLEAALAFARAAGLQDIHGGAIRDVQSAFIIVSVYHGVGRPMPRTYIRVQRGSHVASEDDRCWSPRNLK